MNLDEIIFMLVSSLLRFVIYKLVTIRDFVLIRNLYSPPRWGKQTNTIWN